VGAGAEATHRAAEHRLCGSLSLGDNTGAGSERSLVRGYEYIEELLKEANEIDARGDEDEPLQLIEARDLIPTQKLEQILET
jgi:hypothetical protein